jgi:hypothetical protein
MNNVIDFPSKVITEEVELAEAILKYLEKHGEDPIIRYIVMLEEEVEFLRQAQEKNI